METVKAKLLLVCNKPKNIEFFSRVLSEYCLIINAKNTEEAKEILSSTPDITLTLLDIKNFAGFLNEVRDKYGYYVPAIVCVDGDNEEDSSKALRYGAFEIMKTPLHEEVVKNRVLKIMWHVLGYKIYQDGSFKNQTLLFGSTDGLTHLHNRTYGEQIINNRLSAPDFTAGLFVLMDIDCFKDFNDIFGRKRGDTLLIEIAEKIVDFFDEDTIVCRLDGDGFACFWETDPKSAETNKKIKQLLDSLCITVSDGENTFCVNISVGTVSAPMHGKSFQKLLSKADKALYRSKTMGHSTISDYSENMLFATRENEFYNITTLDYQNILDSNRVTAICAITAKEHKVLYYNKKAAEIAPAMRVGAICHEVWDHDCDTCPINTIGDAEFTRTIRFDAQFGEEVVVSVTKIMWHNRIPAYLMRITPLIKEDFARKLIQKSNNKDFAVSSLNSEFKEEENGLSGGNVTESQYSERVFCVDGFSVVSEREQSIINSLLVLNHGVGIIAGYFDENMSISMISELAVSVLNYSGYSEFRENTGACLLNTVKTEEERSFLRKKLLKGELDVWSFPLTGKNGIKVSVRISNAIGVSNDGRKMWYMSIRKFSDYHHDSLTGGYNSDGFTALTEKLREGNADLRKYAILYIDVKGFKSLNELYGSEGGDNLLIDIYKRLATCKLEPVICARKGSDHFLLLVKKTLLDLNQLSSLLDIEWVYGNRKLFIHCTCGIYYINDSEQEIGGMISCANLAMEQIQDEYATPYAIYEDSMKSNSLSRIEVLSEFETGISNGEFQVYYQPIVDVKTKKVTSAEALVRWISKERGIISPAMFIPALEQSGYIVKLDKCVFKTVRKYLNERKAAGLPLVPISVNLSRMDFFVEEEMNDFLRQLENDSFVCRYMHFEITETSNISLKERQQRFIESIMKLNGEVYLDDYGSGSASLDMIGTYDFTMMKIDMHYIRKMSDNPKFVVFVKSIILMAHELNLKVVAEGVETKEQFEILKSADCDYIQGFLFSEPLPQKEFDAFLSENF